MYSIACIQRPLKGSTESGLLRQVVFKCRFYQVDLRRVVSQQWPLKADGLLIQAVSNTGLTVVPLCFEGHLLCRFQLLSIDRILDLSKFKAFADD